MAQIEPFDRPYSYCEIQIKRDEDWREAVVLRRLMADGSEADMDFSTIGTIELFVRPLFDHSVLIARFSSDLGGGGGIQFSPAVPGRMSFLVSRATVIAMLPVGTWDQFLVATYIDGSTEEFWRGKLIVHPARIA